jgi:hypothetical protein
MKIKFIRGTVASKLPRKIGSVAEIPENEARYLIRMEKAVVFVEPAAAETLDEPAAATGEPEAQAKPAGKKRRNKDAE